ncbi:MAG: hypothetical protein II140_03775 [Paludibacteraceae bacterium]|nr:hypothetical protein [Paludibacteraceae bacterium]
MARSNSGGGLTPSARPFRSPLFPRRLAFLSRINSLDCYLRSAIFLRRLCALTKQLRPSLYLPVAACTSGG